ncbi:ribonuclease catalytic domain-containing protein [Synechococcus sp. PCC 6312]|uniref:ribonuclease catalytic domain-containing protein n=1 Tax=Synechococcus sp. (strain ATCC 27167 / PCC 6312) TaxID=195253 RepID=UPI00029F10C9|nr:ribonuclease R family protein [Synechococcus sp. PCC 6312]AFY59793.1 exoribonuclease R [Synechococcus sp. PCC 6312]
MEKGTLVEFRVNNQRRLGVVERPEGKKHWIVIDSNHQAHTLHPRQITYTVTGERYQTQEIPQFQKAVEPFLDPESLEVAWEILLEENRAVSPESLALLLFSGQTPLQCYAAHYLLSEDKIYFKQKAELYEARPTSQVAEIKHQLEKERQRQQTKAQFLAKLNQALAQETISWEPAERNKFEPLERFAALGDLATQSQINAASELLTQLKRPTTALAAFQLLVDLSLWKHHENLALHRSQIPTAFKPEVVDMARHCISNPPPDLDAPIRQDLTHLKVYTIDDESTQEIDDGISLETLPNGQERLWIHIADPSRWLLLGDGLEQEARRRATTVYLPTGMIPMFPPELATGPMSLVAGKTCCALSFGIILQPDGSIADYQICPSLIKPTYRLTYEDVDMMLELAVQNEPELLGIGAWMQKRLAWRQQQGAIQINMPEPEIKVVDDEVDIHPLADSVARQLVAEMMILTGEVAARFGEAQNIPLPFRSQTQPELPPEEELQQLPPGPVRQCAIRRCMPKSEMSPTPNRHASLGLNAYCQVTSPIRRYSDLIAHMQIKAHLRGDNVPFAAPDLGELLLGVVAAVQETILVERQTTRYWCLEFLRRHSDQVWQALMLRWLREDDLLALVLLEDLGVELAVRFHRVVGLGETLNLRVSRVDPRADQIALEEVILAHT